jgi:hypothetical protein
MGLNSGPCKVLHHLSHTSSPFCFRLFFKRSLAFCLGPVSDWDSYIYASYVAERTGVYQQVRLVLLRWGLANFMLGLAWNCDPPWVAGMVWATTFWTNFYFLFIFVVLGIQPRTSQMLGKCSTTKLIYTLSSYVLIDCSAGVWTWGFHVEPLHWLLFFFFWARVSWTICLDWLWTVILLSS